jgi:hypothetical protein
MNGNAPVSGTPGNDPARLVQEDVRIDELGPDALRRFLLFFDVLGFDIEADLAVAAYDGGPNGIRDLAARRAQEGADRYLNAFETRSMPAGVCGPRLETPGGADGRATGPSGGPRSRTPTIGDGDPDHRAIR